MSGRTNKKKLKRILKMFKKYFLTCLKAKVASVLLLCMMNKISFCTRFWFNDKVTNENKVNDMNLKVIAVIF